VIDVLRTRQGYRTHRLGGDGPLAHEAELQLADDVLRIVALQTLDRGARSAALSYTALVTEYQPSIVLLVGIAGGISPKVRVGDVVFSDEVVYYDARRETPEGTRRRGQSQTISAPLGYRLNEFFTTVGDTVAGPDGIPFHIYRGPIGTGDAVVTDENAEIRRWLRDFHEKALAVETEAGGVAQAFHEAIHQDTPPRGWLTVRGISDDAGPGKGHADHQFASDHAAIAMMHLLPFLRFGPLSGTPQS
jgi:adenosylhomocysteine nucleosidase